MEEGPEPHEWVERSVEHQHHEHEHAQTHVPENTKKDTMISAITAALLAVCAALGSLLSGHYANEAIIDQAKATDKWSEFQVNSTKGHIYEVGRDVIKTMADIQGSEDGRTRSQPMMNEFANQVNKYKERKDEREKEARQLEEESHHKLLKHGYFARAVAAFQVGIVLASISIMVRLRAIWFLSLAAGGAGFALLVRGLLL